jgi:hypothetical protein
MDTAVVKNADRHGQAHMAVSPGGMKSTASTRSRKRSAAPWVDCKQCRSRREVRGRRNLGRTWIPHRSFPYRKIATVTRRRRTPYPSRIASATHGRPSSLGAARNGPRLRWPAPIPRPHSIAIERLKTSAASALGVLTMRMVSMGLRPWICANVGRLRMALQRLAKRRTAGALTRAELTDGARCVSQAISGDARLGTVSRVSRVSRVEPIPPSWTSAPVIARW